MIGVAALQIDTDEIYRLAENYVGLGSTGEIVIAFREGDTIRLAAPMRHDPNAAFKRLIQIGSDEALPIQYAVRGKKGHGVSVDYRGKNILAAWRYLPQTEWGIVVKNGYGRGLREGIRHEKQRTDRRLVRLGSIGLRRVGSLEIHFQTDRKPHEDHRAYGRRQFVRPNGCLPPRTK